MKSVHDGYNYILRLDKGEKLIESLKSYITKNNITSCFISGLGGSEWAELAFYNLQSRQYEKKVFDKTLEIISLQGNISWNDYDVLLHIHATLSDDSFRVFGGHVVELVVGGTCELFLHTWHTDPLRRLRDERTGLNTLDI